MKHLLVVTLIFFFISAVSAQDVILMNFKSLEKKLEKSNELIKDDKKGSDPKTWFSRGELMQDIFEIDLEFVTEGMDPGLLKITYKEPLSTETTDDDLTVMVYERMKYYFGNNALVQWERTKSVTDNPLDKALEAYKKTLEYDENNKYEERVKEKLEKLKLDYKKQGINSYYLEEKEKALGELQKVNEINEMEMFEGTVDTLILHYSGIIAREVENYEEAIKAYKALTELDFGGPSTYLSIKNDYLILGDSVSAIETMKEAFVKYPDTLSVVANLVDLYIRTNEIEKGLESINEAIVNNPEKGELYYWKGRLLLNVKDDEESIDKALVAYREAIERTPNLYYVYYDMGFIYFLQGQDLFSQAGLERDNNMRTQINDLATEKYNDAVPMLEKSNELNTENLDIKKESLDVLKRIYYKLQLTDKYDQVTLEIEEITKQIQAQQQQQ